MIRRPNQLGWQAVVFGALLLLTLLAGVFLYRSINRASEADRMQQHELLDTATRGYASEFNNAVQEVLTAFRLSPRMQSDGKLATFALEPYQSWLNTTHRRQLIGSISIGTVAANGASEFRRSHLDRSVFV